MFLEFVLFFWNVKKNLYHWIYEYALNFSLQNFIVFRYKNIKRELAD